MNLFDWALIALFAFGALYGYKSGLIQSALNLIGVFAAMWLSSRFASGVVSNFTDDLESEALTTAIGYVVIFIVVFIGVQIVGKIVRTMLGIMFLGWVDKLGGIALGVVIGVILTGGLTTVSARYAYVFDESDDPSLVNRLVEDGLNKAGRGRVDTWLVESQLVPTVLDVRDALPGDMLSMVSGDFTTALDILQERVDEAQAAEEG